jgi:hypothetical protein
MIQIIRRSALEEAEVRQHEPRPSHDPDAKPRKGLSSLVQDYVDKAEYVGKVTGHGARKEKTEVSPCCGYKRKAAGGGVSLGRPGTG